MPVKQNKCNVIEMTKTQSSRGKIIRLGLGAQASLYSFPLYLCRLEICSADNCGERRANVTDEHCPSCWLDFVFLSTSFFSLLIPVNQYCVLSSAAPHHSQMMSQAARIRLASLNKTLAFVNLSACFVF